jgi:hypothetical protein
LSPVSHIGTEVAQPDFNKRPTQKTFGQFA